jgi:hypothetical protein
LEELKREVLNIGRQDAGTYKPEISLGAYAERPESFHDEVYHLTKVIPHERSSWETNRRTKSLLESELGRLHEQICSKKETSEAILGKFRSRFGAVYKDNHWKTPWSEGADSARVPAKGASRRRLRALS